MSVNLAAGFPIVLVLSLFQIYPMFRRELADVLFSNCYPRRVLFCSSHPGFHPGLISFAPFGAYLFSLFSSVIAGINDRVFIPSVRRRSCALSSFPGISLRCIPGYSNSTLSGLFFCSIIFILRIICLTESNIFTLDLYISSGNSGNVIL